MQEPMLKRVNLTQTDKQQNKVSSFDLAAALKEPTYE